MARLSAAQRRAMTPAVWRPGCPVPLSELRRVTLTYVGFDGRAHRGALVVNRAVAAPVAQAFGRLYAARFPIRRMLPIEAYGGSDFRSIEADNTSSFNCRSATGSSHWSEHAYGRAIDLDPIENPYVASDGTTSHAASRPYVDRARVRTRPAVIAEGGVVLRAFARIGWGWGGRWSGARDYQHLSASGR
ncbi:MAG TPA: M15 family metallopeptidase [Gaiellales bacterium]|nr:M15 family metallopeptidase [Gaiellales bacterium]